MSGWELGRAGVGWAGAIVPGTDTGSRYRQIRLGLCTKSGLNSLESLHLILRVSFT